MIIDASMWELNCYDQIRKIRIVVEIYNVNVTFLNILLEYYASIFQTRAFKNW